MTKGLVMPSRPKPAKRRVAFCVLQDWLESYNNVEPSTVAESRSSAKEPEKNRRTRQASASFSPDKLESSKIGALIRTGAAWYNKSGRILSGISTLELGGGRVIEVPSAPCCQGSMQGYSLTGQTAVFPSHEPFLGLVHTMIVHHGKFCRMARTLPVGEAVYIASTTSRLPKLSGSRARVANVGDLLVLAAESLHPHARWQPDFVNDMFCTEQASLLQLSQLRGRAAGVGSFV